MTTARTLSDDELLDILENRIPAMVERRPDLWKRVYSAWVDTFARREEIAAIMEELRRLDTNVTALRDSGEVQFHYIRSDLDAFKTSTEEQFAVIGERFVGVDEQFDKVDERFEQVDKRFDKVDERFEQVDERFNKVDERFNKVDERFDKVDERLGAITQDLSDSRDWFELTVGRLQTRAGRNPEDIVAGALRIGLKRPDVSPDQIKLRQKIVDVTGIVYKAGQQKEVDLIASNGDYIVFEVKSAARPRDVDDFADKVLLLRHLNPDKQVRGVFITLAPEPDVRQRCAELNIELAR